MVVTAAGCGGQYGASTAPTAAKPSLRRAVTDRVADDRFTVTFSAAALQAAQTAGVSLPALVDRVLDHVNTLLPGPKASISVSDGRPAVLSPQSGTEGYTNPMNGRIMVAFGTVPQVSIKKVLTFWFPRDLAHEVSHSVRILAGPGHGPSLIEEFVDEGIATAFDQAAFPGPPDPGGAAITPSQECTLWNKAEFLLGDSGIDGTWMFGGNSYGYAVPSLTGFTIGYHIVNDYREQHPHAGWAALTSASAATILAGSGYQPCSP